MQASHSSTAHATKEILMCCALMPDCGTIVSGFQAMPTCSTACALTEKAVMSPKRILYVLMRSKRKTAQFEAINAKLG